MNVEQLRRQAKDLVKAARAGDPAARERLAGRESTLAKAQLVIARENGYSSWPALVAGAEANAEAFVLAATDCKRTHAEAMLNARPEIADDPWARLVLGRDWAGDPSLPGGPRGWVPLLYVCHSCFGSAELARSLLARGADPNVTFTNPYGEMSALYGAAGVRHDPELTRVLLEAGADPDDGESVYHATEAESTDCLRLLLDNGALVNGTNALAHALDDERLEHVRLLLDHGADPNYGALVAHAVRRGRGPEFLRALARHGADLDRVGGETWRGNVPLRSPYQHAVLRGRLDQAEVLAELGARTDLLAADEAVAAIARGERPTAALPEPLDPDAEEVLVLSALRGRLSLVVEAVGPDFAGVVGGSPRGTLLHHAAWVGDPRGVRELLAAGADPSADVGTELATPLGWAAAGSQYHAVADRDYVAVAEALVGAGAAIEPGMLDAAEGPLYAWLEGRIE